MKSLAAFTPRRRKRSIIRRLSNFDVFLSLPPEDVQALLPYVKMMNFPAGTCLMREGDPGDALYLIESGDARVDRAGELKSWTLGRGTAVGEGALITGEPRSATVTAITDVSAWRISRDDFNILVKSSPRLHAAFVELVQNRRAGKVPRMPSRVAWIGIALRAVDASSRGVSPWQRVMALGLLAWLLLAFTGPMFDLQTVDAGVWYAVLNVAIGVMVIQGACEAFIQGVERLGARLQWDGFISGTVGSVLSTLPEFVVITFLVLVEPFVAFVTAAVTIFNNALVFAIYSFFLPKDQGGAYTMPRSLYAAGGEILITGGAISLIIGIVMIIFRVEGSAKSLDPLDLIGIAAVLILIYGFYLLTLVRYYNEGEDLSESLPPDPVRLGHDSRWYAIAAMFVIGIIGAYCGGEAIGTFADVALTKLGMPVIPTAAGLALFAGVSEYIIVYKAHRRGELGIALSNAFGGLTQVMFLLLPFTLLVIGVAAFVTGSPDYALPVNAVSILLMLLLFPLFYTLHQCVGTEKALSNLGAASMTGIYILLLYFLFTASD